MVTWGWDNVPPYGVFFFGRHPLGQKFFFDFPSKIQSCISSWCNQPPPIWNAQFLIPSGIGLNFCPQFYWPNYHILEGRIIRISRRKDTSNDDHGGEDGCLQSCWQERHFSISRAQGNGPHNDSILSILLIIEVIYNITDNVDHDIDLINSRDTQGNSILHLLARKGDTNIETMKSLLNLRLTTGKNAATANLKKQYPIHIAAQSKESQPLTMKAFHDEISNCFNVIDSDGKTALHYSCQRSKNINTLNPTLSGIWNGAGYPGGGSLWPPPEISYIEATESCEGSN